MPERIAESLVLVLPRGLSLCAWDRIGMLEHESAFYARIAERFDRVILVTWGGAEDLDKQSSCTALGQTGKLAVICNTQHAGEGDYQGMIPHLVRGELLGCRSALVRTTQMTCGPVAAEIRDALVDADCTAALVSRGGWLWSRMAAWEHGPGSAQAKAASDAERVLCRSAQLLIGTTQDMLDDLCWRYRIDASRTALIPNFVLGECEVVPASARIPGSIVYAGALTPRKRVDTLVRALVRLPEDLRESVTLDIIGDGPELGRLQELATSQSLPVRFTPPMQRRDLYKKLSSCSIYAQASALEGQSRSVLDALACGAVVVVSDSPGLANTVENGVTGIRVPGSDADGFANAFTGILADDDWRDLLGASAARAVRARHSMEHVVELELSAFRRALAFADDERGVRNVA